MCGVTETTPWNEPRALRNCDAFFTATTATRGSLAAAAKRIDEVKTEAKSYGKDIEVFTNGQVICRPTQKEAEELYHYANIENPDWQAIEGQMKLRGITREKLSPEEFNEKREYYASNFIGGFPFVGTPDRIAELFVTLSMAGLRGIAISFVNYLQDISFFCQEVLPRLAKAGVRQ